MDTLGCVGWAIMCVGMVAYLLVCVVMLIIEVVREGREQ